MFHKYEKYVNALFLGAAAVVWIVSQHYIEFLTGYFQLARRMGAGADVLRHALPIALALLTFVLLRKIQTSRVFTEDAVSEVVKVSWPSNKEVRFGTFIVIITVLVAGVLLGVLDLGLTSLVRAVIGA